jgi:DNA-binding transcriptional regulator YiaG
VSIIDQTGDQWDHQRDDRRDGEGLDLARPRPPTPTARVTLRQMRERAGVSLGDLAAQAGVSISTLRKFETGVPDLAPATYAHTIAALEALIARSAGERPPSAQRRRSSGG